MDKYFYLAVTVKQNKNESIFADQEPKELEAGFYSYVVKCSESDNLKSKLDGIGGLQSVNICPTKKRAAELVTFWNDCHKANGTYLFDTPAF